MTDTGSLVGLIVTGWLLFALGRRWYRQRVAAKSANQLLADVLKGKDAYRR